MKNRSEDHKKSRRSKLDHKIRRRSEVDLKKIRFRCDFCFFLKYPISICFPFSFSSFSFSLSFSILKLLTATVYLHFNEQKTECPIQSSSVDSTE